ncbi:MAG: DUF1836 domain-containing protein [Clostridia bacterium]|nr:DUF1836 domain-containing protein [Clostridia bacterium]
MTTLPGTVLPAQEGNIRYGFANFAPLFIATRGLTLSQVCEIAGLEPTTVQNWIKRGWVAHPEQKRYHEPHLARILVINMLRKGMQLEKIACLLRYINGSADDRNDDIIPDSELYSRLCTIVDDVLLQNITEADAVRACIAGTLTDYSEPYPGAKEKLSAALTVMTLTYIASVIITKAENLFDSLSAERI